MEFEYAQKFSSKNRESDEYRNLKKVAWYIKNIALGAVISVSLQAFNRVYEGQVKSSAVEISPRSMEALSEMGKYYGPYLSGLDEGAKRRQLGENLTTQKPPTQLRIEFERAGNLDEETIRKLISGMPQNWGLGEIASVSLKPGLHKGDADGYILAEFNRENEDITFYGDVAKRIEEVEVLRSVVFHEAAHANDWESDDQLSIDDKIELLWQVTQRLKAGNKFTSTYVEAINVPSDQYRENYRKAVEYWAEISAAYFRSPGQLSIEDFALVDAYVLKNDPNFHTSRSFAVIEYIRDSSETNRERLLKFDENNSQ